MTILNCTGSQIAVELSSTTTKPTWWLGAGVHIEANISGLLPEGGLRTVESLQSELPVERISLINIPPHLEGAFALKLEIPYWFGVMTVRVWQRQLQPATPQQRYNTLTVEASGQAIFTLTDPATMPQLSGLYINGIRAKFAKDYGLDGVVLSWLNDLILDPSDDIEVYFFS